VSCSLDECVVYVLLLVAYSFANRPKSSSVKSREKDGLVASAVYIIHIIY